MSKTVYIVYEYYLNSTVAPRRFKAFFDREKAEKYWKDEENLFGQCGGRLSGLIALRVSKSKKKAQKKARRPRGGTGRRNGLKIRSR